MRTYTLGSALPSFGVAGIRRVQVDLEVARFSPYWNPRIVFQREMLLAHEEKVEIQSSLKLTPSFSNFKYKLMARTPGI